MPTPRSLLWPSLGRTCRFFRIVSDTDQSWCSVGGDYTGVNRIRERALGTLCETCHEINKQRPSGFQSVWYEVSFSSPHVNLLWRETSWVQSLISFQLKLTLMCTKGYALGRNPRSVIALGGPSGRSLRSHVTVHTKGKTLYQNAKPSGTRVP